MVDLRPDRLSLTIPYSSFVIINKNLAEDHRNRADDETSQDCVEESVDDEVLVEEAVGQPGGKPERESVDDEEKETERHRGDGERQKLENRPNEGIDQSQDRCHHSDADPTAATSVDTWND